MNKLYVVIATAGRSELLDRTLASLAACRKPETYRAAIVVENGPQQGAEAITRSFQSSLQTRYLHVAQANKSNALNKVLATLEDGLVFFTDDDVRLHPSTLMVYAAAAGDRESGALYGGPTAVDYEREPPHWLKVFLPLSGQGWSLGTEVKKLDPSDVSFFLGCNWAAFISDIKAIGGFDPGYGPGSPTGSRGQEHHAQDRLRLTGVERIYLPEAVVWHYVPRSRCSVRWVLQRAYYGGVTHGRGGVTRPPAKTKVPRPGLLRRVFLQYSLQQRLLHAAFMAATYLGRLKGRVLGRCERASEKNSDV
ncbi:MAG: glycosyltransferase [Kiritimatiellae bacterium]|nr:glycosyltransferase [Kiritimatiellia bacterium]